MILSTPIECTTTYLFELDPIKTLKGIVLILDQTRKLNRNQRGQLRWDLDEEAFPLRGIHEMGEKYSGICVLVVVSFGASMPPMKA